MTEHNYGDATFFTLLETPEVKTVMANGITEFKIFISGIGKKAKNAEKIKKFLAKKAGIEAETLTIIRFIPRSGSEKGVCVLEAKRKVVDKIKKIQKNVQNWKVRFPKKSSMHIQLSECSGTEQSSMDVTLTYSDAKFPSPPSRQLLQTVINKELIKAEVSEEIDVTLLL